MAIRFDAIGDRLVDTTTITGTSYTILMWGRITSDPNNYQIFIQVLNGSRNIWIETGTDGVTLEMSTSGTTSGAGDLTGIRTLALNTWYRLALVVNGTSQTLYHGAVDGALSVAVPTTAPPDQFIPAQIYLGGDTNGAFLRGDLANLKMYNAALTAAEVEYELSQYQPGRTDTLTRWHPFVQDLIDYSGNGNTLVNNGTDPAISDGPPLRWARSRGPKVTLTAPTDITVDIADAVDITAGPDALAPTVVTTSPGYIGPNPAGVDTSNQASGTVRTANSDATIVSQINASVAGDTVSIAAGTYGYLTVTKSIASGFIRVVPAAGATVTCAGIDLSSAQGIDIRGINTTGTSTYNNWWQNSSRCRWRGGTHTMSAAGRTAFTVRQGCSDIVIEDVIVNNAAVSFIVQGFSETGRSTNIILQRFRSNNVSQDHVFLSRGDNVIVQDFETFGHTEDPEHQDGVQIVGIKNTIIRRGHIWNTRAFRQAAVDRNDHGVMINYDPAETPEGRVPENITLENLLIHDQTSTGIAVAGCLGVTIRNCTSYDNGLNGGDPGLALDADAGNTINNVHVINNIFSEWTNSGEATIVTNTHNFVADASGPVGTSRLTGDPGFSDSANQDYGLSGTSQNLNSASTTDYAYTDIFGDVRDTTPSRGAIDAVTVLALLEAIDITSTVQAVELDKAADLDLITAATADLTTVVDPLKGVDIDVQQAVTVTPQTTIASKHVVVRPPLTTFATVEIPDVTVLLTADVEVDVSPVDIDVSLIGLTPDLEKHIDLDNLLAATTTPQDLELAHATPEPVDPQFINVIPQDPTVLQTSYGVANILAGTVVPQDVETGRIYDLDPIDITTTSEEVEHLREISLDLVDIEITPEFTTVIQTAYRILPIDVGVEVDAEAVDVASEVEVDPLALSVVAEDQPLNPAHAINLVPIDISTDPSDNTVITYQSHRVGIVEINPLTQEPELARAADIEIISVFTQLSGLEPDLAHVFDIASSRLITVEPRPASTQGFDDEPVEINIELLPIDVGFSVEDFSYVRGLRVEPFIEPARVIAQDIRSKKFLHWDLPVSNLVIDYNLSGPTVISGSFDNEILDLQDLGLEANATWIHIEENGFIRASGILQPTGVDEDETLTLEAVGPSAYPTGQPYDNKFEGINLDPADIIRVIWGHLQSYSDANLGVIVRGNTPVKLGKPLPPAPPDPLPEGYVDPNPNDNNDKPYSLLWWEAPDCGEEISKLISETPMDYVEYATWNADKTDVLHYIDLGFPRAGRKRDDISFVQDENLIRSIGPEELEGFWCSNVILMGKGEGSSIIKGYAALPNPRRIRKTYIMTDPTCDNVTRANKLAMQELMRRQSILDIKEIEAEARHINARLGAFSLGDDVPVRGRIPWANTGNGDGEVYLWERILGYTYRPDTESLRIRLRRSESFTYGAGATS